MTIYWTKGFPGSGKSTYAAKLVAKDSNLREVNLDTIRTTIPGWKRNKFVGKIEGEAVKERDRLLRLYLSQGFSVISSDTNLKPRSVKFFNDLANEFSADVECIDFTDPNSPHYVTIKKCIEQDLLREFSVGKDVILKMFYSIIQPVKDISKSTLPKAYIVDLDGTLFHHEGKRGAYEEKYDEDDIDLSVLETVKALDQADMHILLVSGREGTAIAIKQTLAALKKYDVPYDQLLMREAGDKRVDSVIKEEIYNNFIKDKFNVIAAFDDRPQVSRQFESLGIKVFKCGPGYEF